eukprot:scaffold102873_cov60-Phaeocystis_antarctica.AAC.2
MGPGGDQCGAATKKRTSSICAAAPLRDRGATLAAASPQHSGGSSMLASEGGCACMGGTW